MAQVGAVATKTSQETQNSQKTKKKHTNSEFLEILRERNEELKEKILNGETEESVAIGAGSYTKSEWSKFLKDFDDAQDMIKQQIREEITKRVEKQEKIEEIEDEKFEKDIDKDIQDKKRMRKKYEYAQKF